MSAFQIQGFRSRGLGIVALGALGVISALVFAATASGQAVTITTANLSAATENQIYQVQLQATGANITWNYLAGPTWLTLQASGPQAGFLTGTPPVGSSAMSPYNVTVYAFDVFNPSANDTRSFSLGVQATGGSALVPTGGSGGCAVSANDRHGRLFLAVLSALGLAAFLIRRRALARQP
jgi:hypothetical protein